MADFFGICMGETGCRLSSSVCSNLADLLKDKENWSSVVNDHILFKQRWHLKKTNSSSLVFPAIFANGRYFLCFDGRIDNLKDLALSIGVKSSNLISDTSILTLAWEKWGHNSVNHILGEYSFAVWDDLQRSLTLACDQTTGGRSIYYHATDERIAFSSNLATLLSVPDVPRHLDLQRLAGAVHWRWPGQGKTYFRDIQQLPPGGMLRWSSSSINVERYWQPDMQRRVRFQRDSDYVEAARELIESAVTAHSRVEGPLVCELSGGLDSTAIVATLARQLPNQQIYTFTAVSENNAIKPSAKAYAFYDEWTNAQAVAAMYPNVTPIRVPASPMRADMADPHRQFALTGMPGPNPFDSSWFNPAREAMMALGARSVLVGASGNLTLSSAAFPHLSDLAVNGRWAHLIRLAAGLSNEPGGQSFIGLLRMAFRGAWLSDWDSAGHQLGPAVAEHYRINAAVNRDPVGTHFGAQRQGFFERTVEARRVSNTMTRALHCFETRDPFGYLPLIEFCFAIPPDQFLLGGVNRSLARRVFSDRLPKQVVNERRLGIQCPEIAARIGSQRDWLFDTLALIELSPTASEILDTKWIRYNISRIPIDLREMDPEFSLQLRRVAGALQVGQFILWVESGCPDLEVL
jgi:asparagine synthase (glutamine-hydrolysing)